MLGQDAEPSSESIGELRRQAEQGHAAAQFALGDAYALGHGVLRDEAEAVTWWRRAAAQGHAVAQVALGGAYGQRLGWCATRLPDGRDVVSSGRDAGRR